MGNYEKDYSEPEVTASESVPIAPDVSVSIIAILSWASDSFRVAAGEG